MQADIHVYMHRETYGAQIICDFIVGYSVLLMYDLWTKIINKRFSEKHDKRFSALRLRREAFF